MKSPWLPFYPGDFLTGTADLTPAEVGCYIRLLCHDWERDGLEPEPKRLATLAGMRVPPAVLAKFAAGADGRLRNARLARERSKAESVSHARATVAIASWQQRKGTAKAPAKGVQTDSKSTAIASALQPVCSPVANALQMQTGCSSQSYLHPQSQSQDMTPAAAPLVALPSSTPSSAEPGAAAGLRPAGEPEEVQEGLRELPPTTESSAITLRLAQAWVQYRAQCLQVPLTPWTDAQRAGAVLARWCREHGVPVADLLGVMAWLTANQGDGPTQWRRPPTEPEQLAKLYPMLRQRMASGTAASGLPDVPAAPLLDDFDRRRRERERRENPGVAAAEGGSPSGSPVEVTP